MTHDNRQRALEDLNNAEKAEDGALAFGSYMWKHIETIRAELTDNCQRCERLFEANERLLDRLESALPTYNPATHVLIARDEVPEGLDQAVSYEANRLERGFDKKTTRETIARTAALVAQKMGE